MTLEPVAELPVFTAIRHMLSGVAVLVRAARWQEINDALDLAEHEAAQARQRISDLEAALRNAKEDYGIMLASTPERNGISYDPADESIHLLCKRVGYGAVIARAAFLWQMKDPVGAFTQGPCVGTVKSGLSMIRKALKAPREVRAAGSPDASAPSDPSDAR